MTHRDAWPGKEKQDFGMVLARIFAWSWFFSTALVPFWGVVILLEFCSP